MPLYNPEDPSKRAMTMLKEREGAMAAMTKQGPQAEEPEPTAAGGAMSAIGGGVSGALAAASLEGGFSSGLIGAVGEGASWGSAGGWWGVGAGVVLGVAAYYLSS